VRKAHRKGKLDSCNHYGLQIEADDNASLNHVVDLPEIPYILRRLQLNKSNGFYWVESGFYDFVTGRRSESLLRVDKDN
jgi:hypothetical protein